MQLRLAVAIKVTDMGSGIARFRPFESASPFLRAASFTQHRRLARKPNRSLQHHLKSCLLSVVSRRTLSSFSQTNKNGRTAVWSPHALGTHNKHRLTAKRTVEPGHDLVLLHPAHHNHDLQTHHQPRRLLLHLPSPVSRPLQLPHPRSTCGPPERQHRRPHLLRLLPLERRRRAPRRRPLEGKRSMCL